MLNIIMKKLSSGLLIHQIYTDIIRCKAKFVVGLIGYYLGTFINHVDITIL
jgi:hypothetical protein